MEAVAKSRFARYSPRKVGQVLGVVRGKSVAKAYSILPTLPRAASMLVFKTVKSAYSNSQLGDPQRAFITKAWVDSGPVLKRVMPMAMGGRGIVKRKTCHVTVVVSDIAPVKKS